MADETLDDLRRRLAPAIARAAVFDGWSADAVRQAAAELGIDPDVAAYAFRDGAMEMIAAWIAHVDHAMARAHPPEALAGMPVRERIRALVLARLDAVAGLEEALGRALSIMAMPANAARAAKLGWHSADLMWRLAGDRAMDFNHYSKRAILAGVYAATLAVFKDDESEGKAETRAFLDRRIEGIIRFEKAKAKVLRKPEERFSLARFLGRLRYPAT
ncbi:RpsU-divergently transcribed [Novosphingobium sp. PC22D]|uniref:COQ9 family protein n=1 Tax=Novosphingobium sp. PC22D TaxID=1962403 RepID=UPI000BEF8AC3|nr:COQ9 family protein [Novosphingobium sp. PC22D]PEQ11324.1 RpsU-divergently transcribed [Novosphingobium sp. PC22D]